MPCMILSLLQDFQCQISCTKFTGDFVVIRNTYEILSIMEKFHQFHLQVSLSIGEYKSNFWDVHEEKKIRTIF